MAVAWCSVRIRAIIRSRIPKKVRTLAFRKVLSERLLAGEIVVIDELKLTSHKTKDLVGMLGKLVAEKGSTLLVTDVVEKNLKLAARNVPTLEIEPADSVNTYELLKFEKIVATKAAFEKLTARVSKS